MEAVIIIGIFLVGMGIFFAVKSYLENKRSDALELISKDIQMPFSREANPQLRHHLSANTSLYLFSIGHSHKLKNVFVNESDELSIKLFDYLYAVGGGKSRKEYHQSVFLVESKALNLPVFNMKPETVWHKIGQAAFGQQDIDFERYPNFSKNYLLKGQDEQAIRYAFTPSILQHFEYIEGWSVEGDGPYLVVYYSGRRQKPEHTLWFLEKCMEIFQLFKQG